ncbi:L-serine ammonia-lyase [Kangiella koreensis]|uniref:L-serine dehydratase n=1 Tax=Kangiella koreensis (strain DSM 16069 / JCM 12317 / KCTC 12182 / SW-125) TaxID=523791 RepID=C7RAX2_KANKD|nr:L-serine ammonia-lyase [Kangiella koreensis]ACV26414.1 L-serine dehydratase 1 [Kangiella koreensis DSM 16069]
MAISVFDMFSIGIGPSSSHTVGPMRAAHRFIEFLTDKNLLDSVARVKAELYGSLGATGKGHGSDKAVMIGLEGHLPEEVDPDIIPARLETIRGEKKIKLNGDTDIKFNEDKDLVMHRRKSLPRHSNGMIFLAFDKDGNEIAKKTYYSVGGGFVVNEDIDADTPIMEDDTKVKYPFTSAAELLQICKDEGICISTLMLENEKSWRSEEEVKAKLLEIWRVMEDCIKRGCNREGILPGGLKVKRRAPGIYRKLKSDSNENDVLRAMDWVDLYALAVNEENAAGGQVVTAPTNGAAGIIPAVLFYFMRFHQNADEKAVIRFLLTAGAIGILYKLNASISGAEVGCQGEVGVACSMAAGALTEVMGGSPLQVENAAEIGMEHNLGLTCDPVGGLVQVPCIERNAMGSIKAINAARLALRGDGEHKVSLDKVIKTMWDTGMDMRDKYKETARGGLAVHIIEC